jgi:hypothetical protein
MFKSRIQLSMKHLSFFLLPALAIFVTAACVKRPDYPIEPVLNFKGMNKQVIAQGSPSAAADTLAITFGFTDGDGDLGYADGTLDIFLTDSRDGFEETLKLPVIPAQGSGNGISGEITVLVFNKPFNICCTYPNGQVPCTPSTVFPIDTFSYAIRIRDRAGHFSNSVQTGVVSILCN